MLYLFQNLNTTVESEVAMNKSVSDFLSALLALFQPRRQKTSRPQGNSGTRGDGTRPAAPPRHSSGDGYYDSHDGANDAFWSN